MAGYLDTIVDANCLAVIEIPLGSLAEARVVEVLEVRHDGRNQNEDQDSANFEKRSTLWSVYAMRNHLYTSTRWTEYPKGFLCCCRQQLCHWNCAQKIFVSSVQASQGTYYK